MAFIGDALEASDHDDFAFFEALKEVSTRDAGDAGAGMNVVREDTSLGTRAGNRGHADGMEGHDGQRYGLLFADGHEDVHLAFVR